MPLALHDPIDSTVRQSWRNIRNRIQLPFHGLFGDYLERFPITKDPSNRSRIEWLKVYISAVTRGVNESRSRGDVHFVRSRSVHSTICPLSYPNAKPERIH